MLNRARRLVVYSIVAALAVANGFTPRHAQAGEGDRVPPQVSEIVGHHGNSVISHDIAAAHRCHDDGGADRSKAFPDSNCCVASCSAVAFIFAKFELDELLPREIFDLPAAHALTPAAPIGDDPPPR
jgi:hypothetical protein